MEGVPLSPAALAPDSDGYIVGVVEVDSETVVDDMIYYRFLEKIIPFELQLASRWRMSETLFQKSVSGYQGLGRWLSELSSDVQFSERVNKSSWARV